MNTDTNNQVAIEGREILLSSVVEDKPGVGEKQGPEVSSESELLKPQNPPDAENLGSARTVNFCFASSQSFLIQTLHRSRNPHCSLYHSYREGTNLQVETMETLHREDSKGFVPDFCLASCQSFLKPKPISPTAISDMLETFL